MLNLVTPSTTQTNPIDLAETTQPISISPKITIEASAAQSFTFLSVTDSQYLQPAVLTATEPVRSFSPEMDENGLVVCPARSLDSRPLTSSSCILSIESVAPAASRMVDNTRSNLAKYEAQSQNHYTSHFKAIQEQQRMQNQTEEQRQLSGTIDNLLLDQIKAQTRPKPIVTAELASPQSVPKPSQATAGYDANSYTINQMIDTFAKTAFDDIYEVILHPSTGLREGVNFSDEPIIGTFELQLQVKLSPNDHRKLVYPPISQSTDSVSESSSRHQQLSTLLQSSSSYIPARESSGSQKVTPPNPIRGTINICTNKIVLNHLQRFFDVKLQFHATIAKVSPLFNIILLTVIEPTPDFA
jgi:hypothetical protein